MYIDYQSKVFGHPQKFLFLILKVLFLMKQVKHHKFSSVTLTLVEPDIFRKIDLKVFFFCSTKKNFQNNS